MGRRRLTSDSCHQPAICDLHQGCFCAVGGAEPGSKLFQLVIVRKVNLKVANCSSPENLERNNKMDMGLFYQKSEGHGWGFFLEVF